MGSRPAPPSPRPYSDMLCLAIAAHYPRQFLRRPSSASSPPSLPQRGQRSACNPDKLVCYPAWLHRFNSPGDPAATGECSVAPCQRRGSWRFPGGWAFVMLANSTTGWLGASTSICQRLCLGEGGKLLLDPTFLVFPTAPALDDLFPRAAPQLHPICPLRFLLQLGAAFISAKISLVQFIMSPAFAL